MTEELLNKTKIALCATMRFMIPQGSATPNPRKKSSNGFSPFLGLALIVAAFSFLWMAREGDNQSATAPGIPSAQEYEARVNSYLRETSRQIERDNMTARIENLKQAPALNESVPEEVTESSSLNVEFKPDPRIAELTQTLGRDKKQQEQPMDPNSLIQAQLYDQQKWNEYNLAYRTAYAKKFIENARRGGWDIKLNNEFKVIKARPLKKKKDYQLFPENSQATDDGSDGYRPN